MYPAGLGPRREWDSRSLLVTFNSIYNVLWYVQWPTILSAHHRIKPQAVRRYCPGSR